MRAKNKTRLLRALVENFEKRVMLSAVVGSEGAVQLTSDRVAKVNPVLASMSGEVIGATTQSANVPFTPVAVPTASQSVPRSLVSPSGIAPAGLTSLTLVANLSNPHGLTADENGNLWLSASGASTPSNALYEYSSTGTLLNSYSVDTSSGAQPGPVAIVPVNSTTNTLTENTVLWEKNTGAVYAFSPSTSSQRLLFTATSLSVNATSVYDVGKGASSNLSSTINTTTAVYSNGLTIIQTSSWDDFFLTGVSNNVPFILRVREESNSIVSARVIAASTNASSGAAYAGGVATAYGYVMTVLPYGSGGTVAFIFSDAYPESSSTEITYTTVALSSYAATADPNGDFIFAITTAAAGSSVTYEIVNPFAGKLYYYTASVPSAALSYGITFNEATNTVQQSLIFNSVSNGYGEIWNESLASVFAGYAPAQLRNYYGLNQVQYDNGVAANGAGQTIAIIDFNDDPNLSAELATFDSAMGIAAPPSLTQLNETGGTSLPSESSETAEESLDVEWSHAMAPGAKIVVFETTTTSNSDVQTAIATAEAYTGVSVVSMSFGEEENSGEYADSVFTTPAGHNGVTFIASSGDGGAYPGNPGLIASGAHVNSPANSPNVLGVGGTTLAYNSSTGSPSSETAWGYVYPGNSSYYEGSGGGVSKIESEPSWQTPVAGSLTGRGVPDVAFLADPDTGVKQYDMQQGGWFVDGGTSLSAPCWAGFIAIVNQGRALHGQPTLNGSSDLTNPAIYALSASDFNDITSGSNGAYSAKTGYDEVTGRGTPILNKLIPDLEAAYVTVSAVTLPSASQYIRLDPDGTDIDVYNNTTGTGTPAEFYLLSTVSSFSLTGPTSGLAVTVDWSNGVPLPPSGLTFTGQGATSGNQLTIIGTPSGNDSVTASTSQISLNSVPVNFNDVGTLNFTPGTGTDTLTVNSGTLQLSQRSGTGIITDLFSTVTINGTAKLAVAPPATHATRTLVDTATLTIAGSTGAWTGTVDLSGNDLAVTSGNLATISNQVGTGYANGTWTGTGIDSSFAAGDSTHLTALGAIVNTTNGPFDGANPGAAAILVKYTFYGDANLSGAVDGSDYTKIDNGFNTHVTGWLNGDFNYDSVIDGSDYTLIDNAFNEQPPVSLATQIASKSFVAAPVFSNQPTTTTSVFSDDWSTDRRKRAIDDVDLTS